MASVSIIIVCIIHRYNIAGNCSSSDDNPSNNSLQKSARMETIDALINAIGLSNIDI
jgi:hypothetical protein